MNLDKSNQLLSLLGNIGVIAGIVFLGIEMRQNSNMMQAQTRAAISEQAQNAIDIASAPDMLRIFTKNGAGEDLTAEESLRYSLYIRRSFRGAENTFYQHRIGTYTDSEFSGEKAFFKRTYSQQSYKDWWRANGSEFSEEFQKEINAILGESP